jgi:hypothetical protein
VKESALTSNQPPVWGTEKKIAIAIAHALIAI